MRRLPKFILFGTLCLLLLGGYLAWRYLRVQKLQLHVGESMRDVLAHNQRANYTPDGQDDNTPIIWPVDDTVPETFDMIYDGPDGSIRFPHARLVWARQYAGVVTSVLVSASDKKLPINSFYDDLQSTTESFQRAGWAQQGNLPSLAALRSSVSGVKTDGVEGGLLVFTKGTVTASLQVKGFGAETGKNSQDSSSYVLDVEFTDRALQNAQQNKAYKERMQVNGSINKSLPLSHWIDVVH